MCNSLRIELSNLYSRKFEVEFEMKKNIERMKSERRMFPEVDKVIADALVDELNGVIEKIDKLWNEIGTAYKDAYHRDVEIANSKITIKNEEIPF